ncbi:HEAT repeat domain-containing protein [Geoalkalibacter sp.]|uniref:HEAT repeat domain-containing protein n=1 Tax=Geoalkalibacter sp. TaxID=3041440 RepID=UPI00272DDF4E|nr:HEAT repeat domain-containing protein [Geoalkalibacter sp.]
MATSVSAPPQPALEEALRSLGILIKAVLLYPAGHPARRQAIEAGLARFAEALGGRDHLALSVRKDRFEYEGRPLALAHPALKKLAQQLFARRVQELVILADLNGGDLENWAGCIALEADEIARRGGLAKLMESAQITTLWINESDFAGILEQRRAREENFGKSAAGEKSIGGENTFAPPPSDHPFPLAPGAPSLADELMEALAVNQTHASRPPTAEELLARLELESGDEPYRLLLRELVDNLWQINRATEFPRLSAILRSLARAGRDPRLSETKRDACRRALEDVLDEELIHGLVEEIRDPRLDKENLREARNLLLLKGEKAADLLAARLCEETEAHARKIFAQTLVRFESAAVPALLRLLKDERWYVVRNALAILGEIRDTDRVGHLAVFLAHPDVRVRREAIRGLTRIGTPEAMDVLLVAVEEGDGDLQQQALLFLGALRQRAALPHLLRLVNSADPWLRRAELTRGALRALGEIGDEEAIPALIALLRRRKIFRRRRFQDLQEEAALALARIGGSEALAALESAVRNGRGRVARTAERALKERLEMESREH